MSGGTLALSGISKRFGNRQALANVSLRLHQGEVLALLGANGSGKSTLYRILTGVEQPDTGQVLVDDIDVTGLPAFGRARLGLGYLPQEPSSFRGLGLRDTLHMVLEGRVPDRAQRAARVRDLLHRFDLTEVADRKPASLSGGQRRRGELARALATEPRFLLVDEPFASLDPIRIATLAAELRGLVQKSAGPVPGILITDHNIRATLGIADRVVVLARGTLIAEGPANSVLLDPDVRNAILSPDAVL